MKINEFVSFSKESFFNGAVQTEWFYDKERLGNIGRSYVFHGPEYYGVSDKDVKSGGHRLIDTASFTKSITDKLYDKKPDNSFVMTIAGYGAGKSHLAVCLGALFSKVDGISEVITDNITSVDKGIGEYIRSRNTKKNFVIILNGMNNFNLDAEILKRVRLTLAENGIDDSFLRKLTRSYDIAKHFVSHMYNLCREKFESAAESCGIAKNDKELLEYLISSVESDKTALEIINRVYEEVNGDRIAWERGISAGDILTALENELCGKGKPFNKILLIFDEFGRYIEYTAANPAVAGEAALQQIFEAIQTANGRIIFVGFIQSELEAYLSRIEKTSNITRYIDRYRTACENLFLSSNFETILANLLKKKQPEFDLVVKSALTRSESYYTKTRLLLSAWDRSTVRKSVWTDEALYERVILNGCYPLHPITVWLLSNSNEWMQQRSTLAFAAEMFDSISGEEAEGKWLPYIYPYKLIDSGIFNEMLNSEEKGLVRSQYCMLYRDIMVKVGDKLSESEKKVLKSILVINIGHMALRDKDDALMAVRYCADLSEEETRQSLTSLENLHGVISFDDNAKTYDLIAEANGFNEFKRTLVKYRLGVKATINDVDGDVLSQLGMQTPVETSFGAENHIFSSEWCFSKSLIDINDISGDYLKSAIRTTNESYDGEKPRGIIIMAYCNADAGREILRVSMLCKAVELKKYPVLILLLNDSDGEVISALAIKKTLERLPSGDKARFARHIAEQQRSQTNHITRKLSSCVAERIMIGEKGSEECKLRLNQLCSTKFSEIYTSPITFPFDGLDKKGGNQAKSSLITICASLINKTLTNAQVYNSFTPKDKNRVEALLSTKSPYSWKVFDDRCRLVEAGNPRVRSIINEVGQTLDSGESVNAFALFRKYLGVPYGMNENSLTLLISYFIAFKGNDYLYTISGERLSGKHLSESNGKPKLPDIRRISIRKNPDPNTDKLGDLCKRIIATTGIDQLEALNDQLESIVEADGENEQNKYLIAQARAHLDDGLKIKKAALEKLSDIQKTLDESAVKFSVLKLVKALGLLPAAVPVIEEGAAFVYSERDIKTIEKLRDDLDSQIRQNLQRAINGLKCSITELSQFRTTYTRAAKTLREHCYEAEAVAIEVRISDVEAVLVARQRYESSIVDCERDLTFSTTITGYRECEEMEKKLDGWMKFFRRANDLPASVSDPLMKKISATLTSLSDQKQRLVADCENVISSVRKADSEAALNRVESRLYRMSEQILPESISDRISSIRNEITLAIGLITKLPDDIEKLNVIIAHAEDEYPDCAFAIVRCAESRKESLVREEKVWITRFIEATERTSSTMTPDECLRWLDRTRAVPSYFSHETQKRYQNVKKLVESQLHAARVDGLLSMFDALTAEEKTKFRMLLAKRK